VETVRTFYEKHEGLLVNSPFSDVISLDDENFYQKTNAGTWLIDFYAPWCGHCKVLAPVWEKLANAQKGNYFVAKVDCNKNFNLCNELGIDGFPTIALWRDGSKIPNGEYTGTRELEMITSWLESFEEEQVSEEEEDPLDVVILNSASFKRRTSKGFWFVDFYASWCDHCKTFAPMWDELATIENPTGRVTIAKIECMKYPDMCKTFEINEFPSLVMLKDGKLRAKFKGERHLEALTKFIDRHTKGEKDDLKKEKSVLH